MLDLSYISKLDVRISKIFFEVFKQRVQDWRRAIPGEPLKRERKKKKELGKIILQLASDTD